MELIKDENSATLMDAKYEDSGDHKNQEIQQEQTGETRVPPAKRQRSTVAYLRYKRKKLLKRLKQHRRKILVLLLALVLVAAAAAVNNILHLPKEFKASGISSEESVYVGVEAGIRIKVKNPCWMPLFCPAFHSVSVKSASSELVTVVNSSEVASLSPGEEKFIDTWVMLKSPYEVKKVLVVVSKEGIEPVELTLKPLKQVRLEVARDTYVFRSGANSSIEFAIVANETSPHKNSRFGVELSVDTEGIAINGKDAFDGVTMEANVGELTKIPMHIGVQGGKTPLMRLSLVRVQDGGGILFDEKMVMIIVIG